jgi:hypothetical protein
MIKILLMIFIFSLNGYAKKNNFSVSYESMVSKEYSDKNIFLNDLKIVLERQNEETNQELKINLTDNKVIVKINKMNYARLLNQYTYFFLEKYFNKNQEKIYSSLWITIKNLSLEQGVKYLKSNNPRVRLNSIKKGNYTKVVFNNKSLKSIVDNTKGRYSSIYTVELVEYKNFIKSKSYWTEIKINYITTKESVYIDKIDISIK